MQANDPHILAAMDGKEVEQGSPKTAIQPKREEPTAFFFVVFGLVCEALATSSSDSNTASSTRQSAIISAVKALKCLVRPEYSGKAIMESTIFEEFISLCYRLAMTESAAVQIHLVEVLGIFAETRTDAR